MKRLRRLLLLALILAVLLGILIARGYIKGRATVTLFNEMDIGADTDGAAPVFLTAEPRLVRYDLLSQSLTISRDALTGAITETDRYDKLEYEFFLPTDANLDRHAHISNRYISGYTLAPAERDGVTGITLTLHERRITAFQVTEGTEQITIKPVHPRERYDKILLLDPGHGGHDEGAVSAAGIVEWNGVDRIIEKDYNLALAYRVAELLKQNPAIKVYLSRTDDTFISLSDRRELRDFLADLFVSLHANASEYPSKYGLWTYYRDSTGPPDYSSRVFSLDMLYSVADTTESVSYDIDEADFAVLRGSAIPATLVEVGFLTNSRDLQKLATDAFADKLAEGIYRAILEGFENPAVQRSP